MATSPPLDLSISLACSHLLSAKHFCMWRFIVCLYFWFLEIYGHILWTAKVNFYLTFWTLHLCTIYISISLYCTFLHYKNSETNNPHQKCTQYCLYSSKVQCLAAPLSLTVALAFWAFEYGPDKLSNRLNFSLDVQVHAVSAIATVIDFYLCYNSVSFSETWWYLVVVGVTFCVWSIVHAFLITEVPLYSVLDWQGNAVGAIIATIAMIVVSIVISIVLSWSNNKLISKRLQSDNTDDINVVESIQLGTEVTAETNVGLKSDDDSVNPQTPHELP
eukprot:131321_1